MLPAQPDPSEAVFVPCQADTWRDPFAMYRALRVHDPVHEVTSGDYWVLSRFDDVFGAATDAGTFSSAHGLTFTYGEMEEMGIEAPIVMMDPPDHTALRKVIASHFTPAKVEAVEPMIREFVVDAVERLREMGEGDIIEEFFKPFPSMIVAHFLGVPQEDRELFDRWTDAIVAANAAGDLAGGGDAVLEMFGYFNTLIERRRTDPSDDPLSGLVNGTIDGEPVSLEKILGFAFTMVTGGNDTTTGLLGGAAELLTRHPDQRSRLVADPTLMEGAVEEFLRLTSPVQGLARMTTREVAVGGKTIPAMKKVMLLYASANRDEAVFGDSAEELDVGREHRRHMAFSFGRHHCIGAAMARMAARVALEELLGRCPDFAVDYERGRFAGGHFVRRYESLPFSIGAS